MSKKYYAYYIVDSQESNVLDTWKECETIVKGKNARYKSFKTIEEAHDWLNSGAAYTFKTDKLKSKKENLDKNALYFDAGTGRGIGVEVRVTDYKGESLLNKILPKEKISKHNNYLLKEGRTNNYGELVGMYLSLKYAIKKGIKNIYGDSKLVLDYWSKGICNEDKLDVDTVKLIGQVTILRSEFEADNGSVKHISGDYNPADLGFHK